MTTTEKPWYSHLAAKLRRKVRPTAYRVKSIEASVEELKALTARLSDAPPAFRLPLYHPPVDGYDLRSIAELEAAFSSARYLNRHLNKAKMFQTLDAFLRDCVEEAGEQGIYLEFGVYLGRSINLIAENAASDAEIFGFDSFEGLPEKWREGFDKGLFSLDNLPEVRENIKLIEGWFDETLPDFAASLKQKIGFVHIDCDLYSSTKTIFDCLHPHFKDEVILVFDEYFNYSGWEQHEYKAFQEYIERTGYRYEYISCVPVHQQVAVRMFTT